MSVKRKRPDGQAGGSASNKRTKVNTELAQIWEKLADDCEETRLDAALELVEYQKQAESDDAEQILRRLFRGLCSGRKNARPGFYVALVGVLSRSSINSSDSILDHARIISIYEIETKVVGETSGEDDRNHYYGKLLGAKAILESGLLLDDDKTTELIALLTSVVEVMAQKSWLRMEASAVLRSALVQLTEQRVQGIVVQILQLLKKYKLVRTIDGLSIWLVAQDLLPKSALPKDSWTDGNPLSVNELANLKKVLLSSHFSSGEDEIELTGTTTWSTILNPAWVLIFQRLGQRGRKGEVTHEQFWSEVVDEGLLSRFSSQERKLTGLLVFREAFKRALVPVCFSKSMVSFLMQGQGNTDDTYLGNAVQKMMESIIEIVESQGPTVVDKVINGLLLGCDLRDFDVETKTRTVQSLLDLTELRADTDVGRRLLSWLEKLPMTEADPAKSLTKKRNILNILQRAVCHTIRFRQKRIAGQSLEGDMHLAGTVSIIQALINLGHGSIVNNDDPAVKVNMHDLVTEKAQTMLEALLAAGPQGHHYFVQLVIELPLDTIDAEAGIRQKLTEGQMQLKSLVEAHPIITVSPTARPTRGMAVLLALILFQTYEGDGESIEMLDEVVSMSIDFLQLEESDQSKTRIANAVVDIVLSFSSKSSKLFRRSAEIIFGAFAADMTSEGLQALCEVLKTKESREGQQELFDNEDNSGVESDDADDFDMPDSGVEVVNGADDSDVEVAEQDTSDSGSGPDEEGSQEEDGDDELTSFESALAAALGTRKLTEDDVADADDQDASEFDSDMSDSQMMELDVKLAEVFKNQQSQASVQKQRKADTKIAKENVVNLKNRALDLVELFLKEQSMRGLECSELLSSILEMASTTGTPQLAKRGLELIKSYCRKARGSKFPDVGADEESQTRLEDQVRTLYETIWKHDASNALIEVASQLHIFLCKLLVKAGTTDINEVVSRASSGQASKQKGTRKALQEFWDRYKNWLISVAESSTVTQAAVANGGKEPSDEQPATNDNDKAKKVKKKNKDKHRTNVQVA